jgi:hypothetical protein
MWGLKSFRQVFKILFGLFMDILLAGRSGCRHRNVSGDAFVTILLFNVILIVNWVLMIVQVKLKFQRCSFDRCSGQR